MKKKHWIKAARIATTKDFDTAYGAIRFITGECKQAIYDPFVAEWIKDNARQLAHAISFKLHK